MCLQDYQLSRSAYCERKQFALTNAVWSQVLLPDNERIGFLLLGPSTGNVELHFGSTGGDSSCGSLPGSTTLLNRYYDLFNIGLEITNSVFLRPTANSFVTIVEYKLPVDPENLKRLAATGKW